MRYRNIPGTDLNPATICMGGTASIVEDILDNCFSLLDSYVDKGGNFFDTANIYGKWLPREINTSELNIGTWINQKKNRHKVIIATKGGHPHLASMHLSRLSKKDVAADLEESLKALQTDYIDLYWLHRDDEKLPVSYMLEYLNEFADTGKIRYFGCSNWKASRISEAVEIAEQNGIKGFVGDQMMWSLAIPNKKSMLDNSMVIMDDDLMELHIKTGMSAIPYSSQANGFFSKLEQKEIKPMNENVKCLYHNDVNLERYGRIKKLALELSGSITEIVLGCLISQPFTTIPIIGPRTVEQLEDSMKAGDFILDQSMVKFLENPV